MSGEWLTTEEIAETLKVGSETVRRWIRSRKLPAQNIGGTYRVRRADVVALKTTAPVSKAVLGKLRKRLEDARAEAAKVEKQIAEVRRDRDRIDEQRELLQVQVEAVLKERYTTQGDDRQAAEKKLADLHAELRQLEEDGAGLGATYEEWELFHLDLIGFASRRAGPSGSVLDSGHHPGLSYAELELKHERLTHWLEGMKQEGPLPGGVGLIARLAGELAAANEVMAEPLRAYAGALATNAEAKRVEAERQVGEARAEIDRLQAADADELLSEGGKAK